MVMQIIMSFIATASFAYIYHAPKQKILLCALTGMIGWMIYYLLKFNHYDTIIYSFISAFVLTLVSRIFSICFKSPATVFIIPGIFPIVPGAGIYHAAYAFFMNQYHEFVLYGIETLKIAFSISFGIIFALSIPSFVLLFILRKNP